MEAWRPEERRKEKLDTGFMATFSTSPAYYASAPGRTEIGGNHTDHQQGRVLAAAVELDTLAAVRPNDLGVIRVLSEGYPLCEVELSQLKPVETEKNTTAALIRGVAAGFAAKGCPVGGFDAYCISDVLPGSGLSSSAAFEVLMGNIIDRLFAEGNCPAVEIAKIGQQAENEFFGKPCGLMDQAASAVGNLVTMDFADRASPEIRQVDFDFSACGYRLCIIDTGADHADLTQEYADVPGEMKAVAAYFGKQVLREVEEAAFYKAIPVLRQRCGDRAVLRAIHFFEENARVERQVAALEQGDLPAFLKLVKESGRSSYMYLQNVIPAGAKHQQEMALALALCDKLLQGEGAFRVHGGGFAGTVQAFVPEWRLDGFVAGIEAVLGQGSCHVLQIRPFGGVCCPAKR